jgi:Protein DA1
MNAGVQAGSTDERMASYVSRGIRMHDSPVYGDGFRSALHAFQQHGLLAVLEHLRKHDTFPL